MGMEDIWMGIGWVMDRRWDSFGWRVRDAAERG